MNSTIELIVKELEPLSEYRKGIILQMILVLKDSWSKLDE